MPASEIAGELERTVSAVRARASFLSRQIGHERRALNHVSRRTINAIVRDLKRGATLKAMLGLKSSAAAKSGLDYRQLRSAVMAYTGAAPGKIRWQPSAAFVARVRLARDCGVSALQMVAKGGAAESYPHGYRHFKRWLDALQ